MASGFVSKLKNLVGFSPINEDEFGDMDFDLYEDEDYRTPMPSPIDADASKKAKNGLKVVTHPNSGGYEVMIIEPRSFDDSLELIQNLRDRKSVVINLHLLDNEQSQRVVDFLSGATHAIDGHQQKIGDGVFLFTPSNVAISAESEKNIAIKDAFWAHPQ